MPPDNDPFAALPVVRKSPLVQPTGDIDLGAQSSGDPDPFAKLPVTAKRQAASGLDQAIDAVKHPIDSIWAIAKGIVKSASDAKSPVVGGYKSDTSYDPTGLPEHDVEHATTDLVTKKNTPNAVTLKEQLLGAGNTAANLALPAAGALSFPARVALNAGLGAVNDSDEPIRGAVANALLGEGLHALPKVGSAASDAIGSAFDVSHGALEAGLKDLASETGSDQMTSKTGMSPSRRTGDQIPVKYRPPVEPAADAEGVSVGDTPLEQLSDSQLALRARLAEDLGIKKDAIGEIGRRPKVEPDPAGEQAPGAEVAPPVEPPADAAAASFPVDAGGVKPVAAANGSFEVRPGVLRRIADGKDALPTPRLAGDEGGPLPARGRKAPDLFDSARTDGGDLRPFNRVSDDGLIRELTDYQARIVDAQQRAQYNWTQDENFHSTEDGRSVVSATRIGGKGVSLQAKALQNLSDYSRIMKEIDAELAKRGHTPDSIFERQQHLSELDAAVERDALQNEDVERDVDFSFGGDEPPAGRQVEPPPALVGEPRNVPADELVNRQTLDTDPDGSKELESELANLKAQGLDKTRVSFDQQRQAAHDFAESLNLDRKTLDLGKFRRLSGAEIVGLKNILTRNLNAIGEMSKRMASEALSVGDHEQLGETIDKLRGQNDALLTRIVNETAEKGRDLGFLRQLSNSSLDPDAWVITAKRMVGDRLLSDQEIAMVRRLAKEAAQACMGGE